MSERLTVIIPCKNEARNICDCIESVRDVADELIVADSGSTDDTIALARSLGSCRIIQRDWIAASDFKNWALEQATHNWILIVDADERVTGELAKEIREVLIHPRRNGYQIHRANHFMGYRVRFGQWGADKALRLFDRRRASFVGDTDHAAVQVAHGRVGKLRSRLTHFTFWTYDQYFRKLNHYARLQAGSWHLAGKRPSRARMYLIAPIRFFQTYFLRLGFLDGAVGFQVCMMIAFYSFQKQARLWELTYGKQPSLNKSHDAPCPTAQDTVPVTKHQNVA
ncbi:MAG: glycosyltransferase family 2 protein [Planctomycetaceae bacterium]|nr:glycosyltransferase family 2 protein [Planctomycetales bacterium]MCB9939193.1 glycosyltransferase family 2 protein [Planctomycetaceae bacterium]